MINNEHRNKRRMIDIGNKRDKRANDNKLELVEIEFMTHETEPREITYIIINKSRKASGAVN